MRSKWSSLLVIVLPLGIAGSCTSGGSSCPPEDVADGGGDAEEAGADADADADAEAETPPACSPPGVSCDEGWHPEYGLCLADGEELEVAAGGFDMGAEGGDDLPLHHVTLAAFTIDRTEITVARYAACVAAGCCTPPTYDGSYSGREPYYGNEEFAEYPVIFVTWEQARRYCEGLGKRLPTEAQWEFAARGTDWRPYPWGTDGPSRSLANYDRPRENGDTQPVGAHESGASPYGALDMAGNVWEWVNDWYDPAYYATSPEADPPGPETGVARVVRGGSFASSEDELFAFYRLSFLPAESLATVGFRCARQGEGGGDGH
jgi:serine/threonine-protein kinase